MRSLLLVVLVAVACLACASAPPPPTAGEEVCVLDTSLGTMVIRFLAAGAPQTTAAVKALVRDGFFDGTTFYRVVSGHVIQAGDGGENGRPTVPGEFGAYPHVKGAVGLARGEDPDSGSTEIYICHAARPHLDGQYAVFGLLVAGYDVLDRIAAVEVEEEWVGDDRKVAFHHPTTPVVIERARLERRVLPPLGAP